jgi:hypothetical protein
VAAPHLVAIARAAPIRLRTMLLIGTLAALHDHAHLALLLQDGPEFSCPECGKPIRYGE